MSPILHNAFEHLHKLPHHLELAEKITAFFQKDDGVEGIFLSGSGAKGGMDRYSDLDFGFLVRDERALERIWDQREQWEIAPWFHRMVADHVKPYFMIYVFDPDVHVDLVFYLQTTMPSEKGAPYKKVWDPHGKLEPWYSTVQSAHSNAEAALPDWTNVEHEEDRFWGWTHYCWCHVGRGEYYDIASKIGDLRNIVEAWHSRLKLEANFTTRRLEERESKEFLESMHATFPAPTRESLKKALLALIEVHNQQRQQIERERGPHWKTLPAARAKITALVQSL